MKNTLRKSAISIAIIASLGLSGCFDTASSPPLETTTLSKTSTGVITGFGSVFINGVEYETDQSSISLDGVINVAGHDAGLKLGMVVTVSGDATGATGNAVSIQFNDEVEGMVTEVPVTDDAGVITGALKVMGITINTDEDTVFESSVAGVVAVTDLALDHIVEVSGYSAGDGTVWATRIELKKEERGVGDKIEVQGIISGLDTVTDSTINTFMIGEMMISVSVDLLSAEGIVLADGMLVDAKSDIVLKSDGSLELTEIEVKHAGEGKRNFEFDAEDDEVEVEGVITAAAVVGETAFEVNGSTVNFNDNTRFVHGTETAIAVGIKIKIKGMMDADGMFLAKTIVFKPTGDIKMSGPITSADASNNTISMFGLTINLVNNTFVEDDREDDDIAISSRERVKYKFGADDLVASDWLKIKAYKNSNGELVASKMIRKTKDTGDLAQIKGKVSAIAPTIVLSGVTIDLSNATSLVTPAVGDRLELHGSYDENLNIFTAVEAEVSEMEPGYIGGEDAEENREDERPEMDTDGNGDTDTDNDSSIENNMDESERR